MLGNDTKIVLTLDICSYKNYIISENMGKHGTMFFIFKVMNVKNVQLE